MARKTQINFITLSNREKRRLKALANTLSYPLDGDYEAFIEAAKEVAIRALAPKTKRALSRIKNDTAPMAPAVIKNLPFDPRVTRGMVNPEDLMTGKPNDMSEVIVTGFTALIGEPYAISYQGQGIVSNLSPKKTHLHTNTGLGADKELSLHVENSAARLLTGDRAPDGLALIGVSPEKKGSPGTMVADGRLAIAVIGSAHKQVLRDPTEFTVKVPERWRNSSTTSETAIDTAVVYGSEGYPSFVGALYGDMLIPKSYRASVALEAFKKALNDVAVDLFVDPGTLALIDNHVLWHGRRKFAPSFDADGRPYRFIQRVYWTSTLRRFGDWPTENKRLITPQF